jgi:hypothetical protein
MSIEYECPGCGEGIPGELVRNCVAVTERLPNGFRLHFAHPGCAVKLPPNFGPEDEGYVKARLAYAMGDVQEEARP